MRTVAAAIVVLAGAVCFAAGVLTQTGAGAEGRSTGYLIMIAGGASIAWEAYQSKQGGGGPPG